MNDRLKNRVSAYTYQPIVGVDDGEDDIRSDIASAYNIPIDSVSPLQPKSFGPLATPQYQTPVTGDPNILQSLGSSTYPAQQPLLPMMKPVAVANDELNSGKGTTAGLEREAGVGNSWIDSQIQEKTILRDQLIAATNTAYKPNDEKSAGTILGSLAAFAIGMAAGGGGTRGLGIGLGGAGATGEASWKQGAEQDKILKELAVKQASFINDDISRLSAEGARIADDNRNLANQKAMAVFSGEAPVDEYGVENPRFNQKHELQREGQNIARESLDLRRKQEARLDDELQNVKKVAEERRQRAQMMTEAQSVVPGTELQPGKVPPAAKDASLVRASAGAFNSVEFLIDQLQQEIQANGVQWLGEPGQRQAALDAALVKAKANIENMGANWTQMERENVIAQLPAVGNELSRIMEGAARGQDPIAALENFKRIQEGQYANKILAYGLYLPGYQYRPEQVKRFGLPTDKNGIAVPSGAAGAFLSELEKGSGMEGYSATKAQTQDNAAQADEDEKLLNQWGY